MTYFPDLSPYRYKTSSEASDLEVKNVGWLSRHHSFEQAEFSEEFFDLLWIYCSISVVQTRGIHDCDFCSASHSSGIAQRKGELLLLGSAEIRVFGRDGAIYAAPNLIYHYVSTHCYKPPEEFIAAMREGPPPLSPEYIRCLSQLGLTWTKTFPPDTRQLRFKYKKKNGKLIKILLYGEGDKGSE